MNTLLGYSIDGHVVDMATYSVAVAMIPVAWLWTNGRVWWINRQLGPDVAHRAMPWLGSWQRLSERLMAGSALVPMGYLILSLASQEALQDLLDASRYTLALAGSQGLWSSMHEVLKA